MEGSWKPGDQQNRRRTTQTQFAHQQAGQTVLRNAEHPDESERGPLDLEEDEEKRNDQAVDSDARTQRFPSADHNPSVSQEDVHLQREQERNGKWWAMQIELNVIEKLVRFFSCDNEVLMQLALGVYKNLCFDPLARNRIEKAGLIPKFIELLHSSSRFAAIVILYLLSIDESIRYTLAYTELMGLVVQLIMHFP